MVNYLQYQQHHSNHQLQSPHQRLLGVDNGEQGVIEILMLWGLYVLVVLFQLGMDTQQTHQELTKVMF
jgi:hypothetical protein